MSPALTMEDIVEKTSDLPALPAAALKVMREVELPNATAQSVAAHLGQDQALTARVLRLANSAYYGLPRQIVAVPDAVVVLGMRCVRNLCLVASTYPWMVRPLKGYELEPKALWAHSFGVAVGAQLLAQRTHKAAADLAFTAGLLHDLGKVALSIWLENKMGGMVTIATRDHLTFDEVERKVLGFDHAQVGAHMGESWNLPKQLVEVMRYHHQPDSSEQTSDLIDCVHVADYVTMSLGLGLGGDGLRYEFSEASMARLGLSPDDLEAIIDEFETAYEQHEKLFEELAA